jgi:hypothetical protein
MSDLNSWNIRLQTSNKTFTFERVPSKTADEIIALARHFNVDKKDIFISEAPESSVDSKLDSPQWIEARIP